MDKFALISVSDKTGVVDFAKSLVNQHGYSILSTGGTARALSEAGLPVTEVSDHTGFPEMMEGRIKTLHPKIHGGLLCRRDKQDHLDQAEANGNLRPELIRRGLAFNEVDPAPFRAALSGFYRTWKDTLGTRCWSLLEEAAGSSLS